MKRNLIVLIGLSAALLLPTAKANDALMLHMGFGLRTCSFATNDPQNMTCADEWVLRQNVDFSLAEGGGSCQNLSSSSDFDEEMKRELLSDSQEPALACAYGIFRLTPYAGTFLPLALIEQDAWGAVRIILSLAHADAEGPEVSRSEIFLTSLQGISSVEAFLLRGRELQRDRTTLAYPLFTLGPASKEHETHSKN